MARTNWKGTAPYEHILGKGTGEKISFLMEYLRVEKKYEALRFAVDFAYRQLIEHPFTAEPERKKGKWNFIGDNMFKCTCCGVLYTTHQLNGLRNYDKDPYAPYFCPHCGADMRGNNEKA